MRLDYFQEHNISYAKLTSERFLYLTKSFKNFANSFNDIYIIVFITNMKHPSANKLMSVSYKGLRLLNYRAKD